MNDFLKSRTGIVLIAFLAIAGFLLAFEHRAHIFTGNGFLVVLLAGCIVMHLFMHAGHGGHGGHGGSHDHEESENPDRKNQDGEQK